VLDRGISFFEEGVGFFFGRRFVVFCGFCVGGFVFLWAGVWVGAGLVCGSPSVVCVFAPKWL